MVKRNSKTKPNPRRSKKQKAPAVQRTTKQLSVILEILRSSKGPISATDLLTRAQREVPSLNKTTVYRTLDRLAAEGTIEAVMLREGILHYELHSEEHHHHHFVCSGCSKIYCLDGCRVDFSLLLPKGFSLESHEVTLRGRCGECR
jgi:Fur family ferric uptake transcriptional regulator